MIGICCLSSLGVIVHIEKHALEISEGHDVLPLSQKGFWLAILQIGSRTDSSSLNLHLMALMISNGNYKLTLTICWP